MRQDLKLLLNEGTPVLPAALRPGNCNPAADWPAVTLLESEAASDWTRNGATHPRRHRIPRALRPTVTRLHYRRLSNRLRKLCRDHGVRHIHAEFADAAAVLAKSAARRLSLSFSCGLHARDVFCCKYALHSLLRGAAFVTVCNHCAARHLRSSVPELGETLHVIPHGVDLQHWPYRAARPTAPRLTLLFAGRLVPKKGLDVLLRALGEFIQAPNPELVIAGRGPALTALREEATRLKIADHLRWEGLVGRERLRALMLRAHMLVVPSVVDADGDRDGIPNVILEALATGLPVVATDAGSIPEVVTPRTGWPVSQRAPEELAAAIDCVAEHPGEARERSRAGRQAVETRFDAHRLARRRAELLRSALS